MECPVRATQVLRKIQSLHQDRYTQQRRGLAQKVARLRRESVQTTLLAIQRDEGHPGAEIVPSRFPETRDQNIKRLSHRRFQVR